MQNNSLAAGQEKYLRQIGHSLKPVVSIGNNGITENVVTELNRALSDHELIKVKLAIGDREQRQQVIEEIAAQCTATCVQSIGKIVLLFRANPKPNPKLSNILRNV